MKKTILSTLLGLGLVSGVFAAGSYIENFNAYSDGAFSGFANGATLTRSGSGTDRGQVYANGVNWTALRLVGDNGGNETSSFTIPGVETSGQRIKAFDLNFGLHLKNDGGLTGADIADRFMVEFGTIVTAGGLPVVGEKGSWWANSTGNLLSIVWDFYDNDTSNGSGDGNNTDRIGIEIYKNGTLMANSFRTMQSSWVAGAMTAGAFDEVAISWSEATGVLDMTVGGSLIYSGFDLGGFAPLVSDNKFFFSATTGAESMDVFVDNISINTVPEPSAGALLVLGLGSLIALRRARRSAV